MDKYLIRKPRTQDSSPMQDSYPVQDSFSKRIRVDFNLENLPSDLGLRQKISSYHPNNHDKIRRYYLQKGLFSTVMITLYHIFLKSPIDLYLNGMKIESG